MKTYKQTNFLISLLLFICPVVVSAQGKPEIPDFKSVLTGNMSDSAKTFLFNKIISYYNTAGNDSAVMYANQGLQLFKSHNYVDGQAWMIYDLADNDDNHGSLQAASEKALLALNLFKTENDQQGLANSYNLLGGLEERKGNFDKAIAYLIEELKIFDANGDKSGLLRTWINLGSAFDDTHNEAKTLEYYHKADSISQSLPVSELMISLYNNLGTFYFAKKDTVKAFGYFRKVLEMSNKPEYRVLYVKATMNIGTMDYQTGNKKEGEEYLAKALALTQQYNMPEQETTIWLNVAWFRQDKPIDTLIAYVSNAYRLVQVTGNKIKEQMVYDAFAQLYERKDDYKDANKYLKAERKLTDSLFNVNKEKEIASIASVYDLKQSNVKVNWLTMLLRRNRQQKDIIVGIAVLIIILLVILYRNYRKTMVLNKHLEEGKKELAELNSMKDKLFSVIGHDMRGPIANIPVILDIIESEVAIPEEYKEMLASLKEHAEITIETLDKLMLLARAQMKGNNYSPATFSTKEHINKNKELLAFPASKKKLTIVDNTPGELSVYADPSHFDFVVRNLLSNAIKFSFEGGKIELSAADSPLDNMVVFAVKDNGTGIKASSLAQMFKSPLTSAYGTANEKGNGIGLMLCEEFVTLNGGKIWVQSKEGEGSTFFFSLKKAA